MGDPSADLPLEEIGKPANKVAPAVAAHRNQLAAPRRSGSGNTAGPVAQRRAGASAELLATATDVRGPLVPSRSPCPWRGQGTRDENASPAWSKAKRASTRVRRSDGVGAGEHNGGSAQQQECSERPQHHQPHNASNRRPGERKGTKRLPDASGKGGIISSARRVYKHLKAARDGAYGGLS